MAGGAVLGLALAIKPVLIALLLVLVFARAWRALVTAVVVPVALNLVLLPADADPSHFITAVVPILLLATFLSTGLAYNHYVLLLVPPAAVLAAGQAGRPCHPVAMSGAALSSALMAWVHEVGYRNLSAASVAQSATPVFLGVAIAATTAVGVVVHSPRPRRRPEPDGGHRHGDISTAPPEVSRY